MQFMDIYIWLFYIGKGCLDQLMVSKGGNEFSSSCGEDDSSLRITDGASRLPEVSFPVKFLSGRQCTNRGFYMWVKCLPVGLQNRAGCSDVEVAPRQKAIFVRQNKRNFILKLHYFIKPFSYTDHGFSVKRQFFKIPKDTSFTYQNNRIQFSGSINSVVKRIYSLIVFNYQEEGIFLYCGYSQKTFTGLGLKVT